MKPQPSSEETLFHAALLLPTPARAAFLDGASAADPALRARLEALLSAHEQSETLMATKVDAQQPSFLPDITEAPDEAVSRVRPFQFRGGGKSLIVFSDDGLPAREWNLTTFQELGSWQDLERSSSCLSPDEQWFFSFVEDEGINSFLSRDMVTGSRTVQSNTLSSVEHVTHIAISPDGKLFVASSEKGHARILDRATLRPVGTLSGFLVQAVFSSCFSPDGKRLATSSGGRETLRLWDVDRRQILVGLEASQRALFNSAEFSPDGNILGAVPAGDRSIHFWRAPSFAEIEQAEAAAGKSSTP